MIVKEIYGTRSDGVILFKTYSDAGKTIIQNETGVEYDAAIDVETAKYTYFETNNDISSKEATTEDYEAALAELGVK